MGHRGLQLALITPVILLASAVAVWQSLSSRAATPAPMATPVGAPIALAAGCNSVALTFPRGTSLNAVAATITPKRGLAAIWRQDAAAGRYQAFSPRRDTYSDYTTVQSTLEPVLICTTEPATMLLPAEPASGVSYQGLFSTLPPGWVLPGEQECAERVRRSSWEPRPANATANNTIPAGYSPAPWTSVDPRANTEFVPRISGRFTGTTDEIIQWGACKWGFDEDMIRAAAVQESFWRMSTLGDFRAGNGGQCVPRYPLGANGQANRCPTSFGLLQLKWFVHHETWPWSEESTAFNVDYTLAFYRSCYEGYISWLRPKSASYAAGDLWGCLGAYYSGGWYDGNAAVEYSGANWYIERVKFHLAQRTWERPGF